MGEHETAGTAQARIPAAAAAIVKLLNSRPHATPLLPDRLADSDSAIEILGRFGQPNGVPPTPELLDQVSAVRDALLAIVTAPGEQDAEQGWADLTTHASTATFQQVFSTPGQARLEQVSGDPIIGRIALDVAELTATNAWSRIRLCANDYCHGAFYDTTRSRTQRWDSYETCGNRVNVAAYRTRRVKARSSD